MKTLGDVKVGESSTIVKLHGEGALRRHLMDLGLIKGTFRARRERLALLAPCPTIFVRIATVCA